jgi:hypothetical protein
MRNVSLGLMVLVALSGACGGGDSTPDANPLGQACTAGDPCGNAGLSCIEDTCTTTGCTASSECRAGTECRNVDGTFACVALGWSDDPGKYGTNCALHGVSDCAGGYACVSIRDSDPYAYCTTACTTDRNCPPQYFCGTEMGDPQLKCLKREFCAPCELDEQCQNEVFPDGVCADDGSGVKTCSKGCDPKGETCPPVFACTGSGADSHCTHKSGACTGDGSMCAPCLQDADCSQTTGSRCIRLYFSGEHFCSPPCGAGCPAGSFCANLGGGSSCIPDNEGNTCENWAF